ncbi:MAG: 4-hydroxy-tetrahydrodipicolinate synthase [Clostridiales bacterium]|nr:4-hydroxy-tetrahydrodipicolinate synthase [Clostridiales bacterium]
MKKKTVFTGSGTAIITPFKDNVVDYDAFGALLDFQLNNKTDAIIVCGTTGEASTLTDDEHIECIRFAVQRANGRIPVIAGTGSNDTDYAIWLSKSAEKAGADALLVVTPYYNKATQKGLVRHFTMIADSVNIPIILYNVPSRTGCNIPISVYRELANHERIVGIKEASGNISAIAELAAECGDYYDIYSGNDDQILPILSLGGKGVISVLSNIMPAQVHEICSLYFEGKTKESTALQLQLLPLINKLFVEVNPIPVKTAAHYMGFCTPEVRMPLCEMEKKNAVALHDLMRRHKLI